MKLSSKELKSMIADYNEIKEKKSELAKEEKVIKDRLMNHLDSTQSESVAVGDTTVKKKVSSYGFVVTTIGVKVTHASNDLTKKLLEDGKNNLLSIKPKEALLWQLKEQNDTYTQELLKGLGLDIAESFTLEIK